MTEAERQAWLRGYRAAVRDIAVRGGKRSGEARREQHTHILQAAAALVPSLSERSAARLLAARFGRPENSIRRILRRQKVDREPVHGTSNTAD